MYMANRMLATHCRPMRPRAIILILPIVDTLILWVCSVLFHPGTESRGIYGGGGARSFESLRAVVLNMYLL